MRALEDDQQIEREDEQQDDEAADLEPEWEGEFQRRDLSKGVRDGPESLSRTSVPLRPGPIGP
ncbi:hypothetical protein GCM10023068_27690 [Leifsonia shinshuensis]